MTTSHSTRTRRVSGDSEGTGRGRDVGGAPGGRAQLPSRLVVRQSRGGPCACRAARYGGSRPARDRRAGARARGRLGEGGSVARAPALVRGGGVVGADWPPIFAGESASHQRAGRICQALLAFFGPRPRRGPRARAPGPTPSSPSRPPTPRRPRACRAARRGRAAPPSRARPLAGAWRARKLGEGGVVPTSRTPTRPVGGRVVRGGLTACLTVNPPRMKRAGRI